MFRHPSHASDPPPPTHTHTQGNSHRPIDTLQPLAEALEKSLDSDFYFGNHDGWAQRVQDKLEPDQTIVVAWHHGEMHQLVKALVAFDKAWTSESFGWPSRCINTKKAHSPPEVTTHK